MLPSLLLLPLLALLTPKASAADTRLSTHSLPLYHRIISLSSPLPPWSRRGVIHLDSHTSDAWLDENGISPSSLGAGERYQLGLGRHESTPLEELNVIIVDSTTFEETLVLAYTRAPTQELIHFRYITSTLEGCEKEPKGPLERAGGRVEVEVDRGVDAEPVRYKEPVKVEVGKDGKVVVPPKEKSMIEKYWIYAIPVMIMLAMGGGGAEEGAPPPK